MAGTIHQSDSLFIENKRIIGSVKYFSHIYFEVVLNQNENVGKRDSRSGIQGIWAMVHHPVFSTFQRPLFCSCCLWNLLFRDVIEPLHIHVHTRSSGLAPSERLQTSAQTRHRKALPRKFLVHPY